MPVHSRPHLTTHNRAQGHSAVAAAAYRLGLRLLDRRTGTWHDYTKRSLGEEVVAAMTIAPEGSPSWVEDPDELWNRVEESERRKDAQVARDYVIPVPLGLDDARATELARRLARYISDNLGTPVSIGIHRDADVDLFGNPKPRHQQGYHAHLLFPTRIILLEGDEGTDEAARQGFGAKLSVLSNRRTSAGIVEAMNREWSNLSNELVAEVGLKADYDWRSYERLGIDRVPRPRLTQKEVALEKKGFFTRQGDMLRDIVVMSEVYKQAHSEAVAAQHEIAQADVTRERSAPDIAPAPMADAVVMPEMAVQPDEVTTPDLDSLEIELAGARARGRLPHSSLADQFVAHSAVPTDEEGRATLFSLSGLVWSIQKALRSLGVVLARLAGHQGQIRRVTAGDLDVAYQIDEARRRRGAVDSKIEAYRKAHPWEVFAKRTFGQGDQGVPRRLRDLPNDQAIEHFRVGHNTNPPEKILRECRTPENAEIIDRLELLWDLSKKDLHGYTHGGFALLVVRDGPDAMPAELVERALRFSTQTAVAAMMEMLRMVGLYEQSLPELMRHFRQLGRPDEDALALLKKHGI